MVKQNPSTIVLIGNDFTTKEAFLEDPDVYGGDITPGMLVERVNTDYVQPHSTSTGLAAPIFAQEMGIDGRGIDDAYTVAGETVLLHYAKPGDVIYALLAAGQDVAAHAVLASNGDGTLIASGTNPVCKALEAVDNAPGLYGAPARIRVEVL